MDGVTDILTSLRALQSALGPHDEWCVAYAPGDELGPQIVILSGREVAAVLAGDTPEAAVAHAWTWVRARMGGV